MKKRIAALAVVVPAVLIPAALITAETANAGPTADEIDACQAAYDEFLRIDKAFDMEGDLMKVDYDDQRSATRIGDFASDVIGIDAEACDDIAPSFEPMVNKASEGLLAYSIYFSARADGDLESASAWHAVGKAPYEEAVDLASDVESELSQAKS